MTELVRLLREEVQAILKDWPEHLDGGRYSFQWCSQSVRVLFKPLGPIVQRERDIIIGIDDVMEVLAEMHFPGGRALSRLIE